jgi:hypothetical protein
MRLSQEQQRAVEAAANSVVRVNVNAVTRATHPPKKPKYRNTKIKTPDGTFDSKREYERWAMQKVRQRAGEISNLRRQVKFNLRCQSGEIIARYWADIVYVEHGQLVVEDVKSAITKKLPAYRLKKRWMKADHGIDIIEV